MSKQLPANLAAETGVLSCVFTDPSRVLPAIASMGLSHTHFHDMQRHHLFKEVMALYRSGKTVDLVTLSKKLNSKSKLYKELTDSPSSDTAAAAKDKIYTGELVVFPDVLDQGNRPI